MQGQPAESAGERVAVAAQLRRHVAQHGKAAVDTADGQHRDDRIRDKIRRENADQHHAERKRKPLHERLDRPVQKTDRQNDAQPPREAELQADVAAEVHRLIRVIPPRRVEKPFERPAAGQFQRACKRHAAEEKQRDIVGKAAEHREHDHHAEAVDRAHGAVQKAAVDELSGADRAEHDLHAPAEKGIYRKIPEQLVKRQAQHLHAHRMVCLDYTLIK